jgi:hypothetical protein
MAQHSLVGLGLLIAGALRSHSLSHTACIRTPLDEWSAWRRELYFTTRNIQNRQTHSASAGFEPQVSASHLEQLKSVLVNSFLHILFLPSRVKIYVQSFKCKLLWCRLNSWVRNGRLWLTFTSAFVTALRSFPHLVNFYSFQKAISITIYFLIYFLTFFLLFRSHYKFVNNFF